MSSSTPESEAESILAAAKTALREAEEVVQKLEAEIAKGDRRSLTERLFRRDLKALLEKYNAELEAEGDAYSPTRLSLYIPGKYSESGDTIRPVVDTYLPSPCHGDDSSL